MPDDDPVFASNYDSAYIAGWQLTPESEWNNVEAGGKAPTPEQAAIADTMVIRIETTEGDVRYYTIHGGVTDDYPLDEVIDDLSSSYGEEFV